MPTLMHETATTGNKGNPCKMPSAAASQRSPKDIAKMLESGSRTERMAGVQKLAGNRKALEYVAEHSEHRDARLAAVKRLTDARTLEDIASDSKHKEVRLAAVDALPDNEEILARVCKRTDQWDVKDAIADKLAGMLERLESPYALACVVDLAKNEDTRKRAVARLTSMVNEITKQDGLRCVARYSDDESARRAAVEKLTDDAALKVVAVYAASPDARLAALGKLADSADVERVASVTAFADTGEAAVRILTDDEALQDVALNAKNKAVRVAAAGKLGSADMLEHVIYNTKDAAVQKAAVAALTDVETLVKVAGSAWPPGIGMAAFRKLAGDRQALIKVANESDCDDTRHAAIKELNDEDALKDVARHGKHLEAKDAAEAKLRRMRGEDTRFVRELSAIMMESQV